MDYNYIVRLGDSNTSIVHAGDGLILLEPSVVAVEKDTKQSIVGVGSEALKIATTNPNIELVYPVSDGVIKNKAYAIHMLREFLRKVEFKTLFTKNNVVVLVPSSINMQEKNDYVNVAYACMFTQVTLLPTVYAGMVNMEIEENDTRNHLLCKLGGGITDVAIISAGNIVNACTIDLGGNTLDNAIKQYIFDSYHIELHEDVVKEIKQELATLLPNDNKSYAIYAQDSNGNYGNIEITSTELRPIFIDYFKRVSNIISGLIGSQEHDVVQSVGRRGVYLFGALASVTGLDRFLHTQLNVPVYVDLEPDNTVFLGATALLNNPQLLNSLLAKYNE